MTAVRPLLAVAVVVSLLGCSKKRTDIREWRPTDHDQENEPGTAEQAAVAPHSAIAASGSSPAPDRAADGRKIWESLCASCHGQLGPNGRPGRPLVGVRDLSDRSWQASVRDEDIQRTIQSGRGRMPAFRLSQPSVEAVTTLIRSFSAEK